MTSLGAPSTGATASAVERALAELDAAAVETAFREQDEFVFIGDFLSSSTLSPLLHDVERLERRLHRNYIPRHKKGGSVSHFVIAEEGPALLEMYRAVALRRFLSRLAGVELQLCPDEDPHACALYFYTEAGDHMGYHYDTSHYRGARYTVLVGLVSESSSRLRCRLYTRRRDREPRELEVATAPGSMVVFNGDTVYHGVTPSRAGERRVVFTMEYVTSPEMSPGRRAWSNLKDAFAYFGVRTLWQSRARARHGRRRSEERVVGERRP
jgi:hypothetical protein